MPAPATDQLPTADLSSRLLPEGGAGASPSSPAPLRSALVYAGNLLRVSRWQMATAVLLMVLTSLTEGIGVALLFPILQVAGFNMENQGHVGHYTQEMQHFLRDTGLRPSLWLAALLMLFMLLIALRSLLSQAQSVRVLSTVLKYEIDLSQQLYQSIIHADWQFLVRRRSSDFTHALTAELGRVTTATYQFAGAVSSAILVLVYMAIALKLSAQTTLLVLAAGAILIMLSRHWVRAMHESGAALSDSMRAIYSAATEHLQNLKAIKTYDAQAADLHMFRALENAAVRDNLRTAKNQAASSFWFEAGSLGILAGVIYISLHLFRVGPASVLLLLAVFMRLMPRLATGNAQVQAFLSDLPAFENVMRLEQECRSHAEPSGSSAAAPALTRELRLENISFRYDEDRPAVLHQLSLSLFAGQITALAGPSGSGKSTVADIVNGLLTPTVGRMLVDGIELKPSAARSWRRQTGCVTQDTFLFHDSVRANLLWASPQASPAEIESAILLAAAEFVYDLPRGLDTTIGDRGVLLSHGQRQRLALARALMRKPSLLILDEATSSLDPENEERILDTIDGLKGKMTIFMIAHRASTLEHASVVHFIEEGRVIESGDWTSLSHQGRTGLLFNPPRQ